jgi:hypothetical protein
MLFFSPFLNRRAGIGRGWKKRKRKRKSRSKKRSKSKRKRRRRIRGADPQPGHPSLTLALALTPLPLSLSLLLKANGCKLTHADLGNQRAEDRYTAFSGLPHLSAISWRSAPLALAHWGVPPISAGDQAGGTEQHCQQRFVGRRGHHWRGGARRAKPNRIPLQEHTVSPESIQGSRFDLSRDRCANGHAD